MKLFKHIVTLSALLAALCLTSGFSLAGDQAQVLQDGSQKLESAICEEEGRTMMQNVDLFKEAGLAYQPSLVAPLTGTLACKDKEQLRMLTGLYAFDANYALLFGKKKEFLETNALLNGDLTDRLGMREKMKVQPFTPEEVKQITNNPSDPASVALYRKQALANIHAWIQASATDPEMGDLMLDAFYGSVIEALYVSCKLALAAGPGEDMVMLFNEQSSRMNKAYRALEAYADNDELAAMVERDERQSLLKPIMELLVAKKGALTEEDVKTILADIEPVRAKLVAACQ